MYFEDYYLVTTGSTKNANHLNKGKKIHLLIKINLNEKSQSFKRRTFLKIKNKEQFCFY
jgi:hypothetical protein